MKVLAHILAATIEKRGYETGETDLLTRFYTARWVHRPDKDELMTYYRLLLESLKASADLADGRHGFKLNPQALNTIADFEQEDRGHRDNYKTQRGIFWLTIVLMFVGAVQAGAAAYEAWCGQNRRSRRLLRHRSGMRTVHRTVYTTVRLQCPAPSRCNVSAKRLQRRQPGSTSVLAVSGRSLRHPILFPIPRRLYCF